MTLQKQIDNILQSDDDVLFTVYTTEDSAPFRDKLGTMWNQISSTPDKVEYRVRTKDVYVLTSYCMSTPLCKGFRCSK